jgi:hypothetical protein
VAEKAVVIPPHANAEFVCAMEDVLEVYHRDFDPQRPVVCLDESSKQLVGEVVRLLPVAPGQPQRLDYEYERKGTVNLFLVTEPMVGQRWVKVTDRRTAVDFAHVVREFVDERYPQAKQLVLVLDNLNTHKPASLYEAFAPAVARRLLEKLEIHYTPKHGSWLNIAEIEFSVLNGQCLNRRLADKTTVQKEVVAWQRQRNRAHGNVDWQFSTKDARIKLKRLYTSTQDG